MQAQIHELIVSLQKEYLFILNEKNEIHKLFNEIQSIYDDLYRKKYILNSQQLINIEYHNESFHLEHIKNFFLLESKINFIKFSAVYNQYEYIIIELMKLILSDNQLITELLLFCDEKSLNIIRLSSIIYKSLFGSAISNSDNDKIISVLINLINRQFSNCIEPQKMIIGEKCAFIRLFKFYIDNSLSAKTFLIATLQEPIEFILMNDESYLDINSKLTLERLTHSEKLKLFGDPKANSKYNQNTNSFRNIVLNKIAEAVNMFVKKLTESFVLLPQNYVIIVNNLYITLSNNPNIKKIDVLRTCIDFIFDCFIYPAMLNPESHGIIGDFPLSSISKHNLMEIGKVIKSLIYGEINKVHNTYSCDGFTHLSLPLDLLEKFQNCSLHSFLTELSIWSESTISNIEFDSENNSDTSMDLNRSITFISESDLYFLLKILKCFSTDGPIQCDQVVDILDRIKQIDGDNLLKDCVRTREMQSLSSSLKDGPGSTKFYCKPEEIESLNSVGIASSELNVFILIINQYIECPGMKSEEKVIKELKCRCESSNETRKTYSCIFHNDRNSRKQNTDNSVSSLGRQSSRRDSSSSRSCVSSGETSSSCRKLKDSSVDKITEVSNKPDESTKISFVTSENGKRKTHFNESNDQESTGATSDIVEGISEIASTHSAQSEDIDSRLDIDENNDNLRLVDIDNTPVDTIHNQDVDTTSSNDNVNNNQSIVSGERGEPAIISDVVQSSTGSIIHNSSIVDLEELRTSGGIDDGSSDLVYWPNMSGRDTPSMSGGRESPSSSVGGSDLPNNIKPDVTEKFWKFDIPKTVEARSTVSDTWSTDVLASDSETTEQADNIRRLVEIQEENHPSNQSQLASGSEDNSDVIDFSVKVPSSSTVFDKHDQVRLNQNIKTPTSQHNQSTDTLTSKDCNNIPNIQLENTLTSSFGPKTKLSRANIVSGRVLRNNNSLPVLHATPKEEKKDEEKVRSLGPVAIETSLTGSPSATHRTLVNKIRDRFSNTKVRKDSRSTKLDTYDNKSLIDESGKANEKTEKPENTELSESVEQMLLRYDNKSEPKTSDYIAILNNNAEEQTSVPPFYDPKTPPETWPAWKVAKKNLRIILEKHYVRSSHEKLLFLNKSNNDTHPLIRLLRLYLAEANLLQNDFIITQLEEAIRVVQLFDNESLSRMISSMLKDWKQRKAYIAYLVNTHIELRLIKKRAEELLSRCERSCQVTSRSMISYCVHQILRQQNLKFEEFYKKFSSINNCDSYCNSSNLLKSDIDNDIDLSSESESRAQMVSDMLDWASRILNSQPYLNSMTHVRQQETRVYLERMVMSQLHRSSIILNDDIAELDRDNVFHRELELLQKVITPSQLFINKKFHSLLPFEVAQKELLKINCYKTPHDKVFCIQKTTHKIAILLKMINSDFIPGADDILPVLIYVIIMANPPRMLSNMSFIEVLCGNQLEGQNQYMWCQFSAAINEVRRLLTVHSRIKK